MGFVKKSRRDDKKLAGDAIPGQIKPLHPSPEGATFDSPAQRAGLWNEMKQKPCKGETIITPLQGLPEIMAAYPPRCVGLLNCAPSGLQKIFLESSSTLVIKASLSLLFTFALIFTSSANAQEKKLDPPVIATTPQTITGKFIVKDNSPLVVVGITTYQLSVVNSDETFSGVLTFKLSEDSRQKISRLAKVPESEVPNIYEQKDVISGIGRNAKYPDIQLEIQSTNIMLNTGRLYFQKLSLTLPQINHHVSELICIYARRLQSGREIRGLPERINRLLVGEDVNDLWSTQRRNKLP